MKKFTSFCQALKRCTQKKIFLLFSASCCRLNLLPQLDIDNVLIKSRWSIEKQLLHYYTRLTALFPGLPRWASTRKVKPILILLKQETASKHWRQALRKASVEKSCDVEFSQNYSDWLIELLKFKRWTFFWDTVCWLDAENCITWMHFVVTRKNEGARICWICDVCFWLWIITTSTIFAWRSTLWRLFVPTTERTFAWHSFQVDSLH